MKFEPSLLIDDLTGGLNTKQRPNKIADNQLQSLISMDFVANSLQRARGYTLLGTEPDNTLSGKTIYPHTVLGTQALLVKSIGTYLKYFDEVDKTFYKLTASTFTANKRWSFVSFNGYLYGVNGADYWTMWNGSAQSTLKVAITAVDTIITLQTGHGGRFTNAPGYIMIQDERIPYTAVAGDTLTGCTVASSHAVGATVITELNATFDTMLTIAKRIEFFQNRIVAFDAVNPNIVRHSKLAGASSPQLALVNFTIAGSGSGDAGFNIAPKAIRSLKTFSSSSTQTSGTAAVCMAFCEDGIAYSFAITDSSTSTTSAFVPVRTMGGSFPGASQMVTLAENDLAITDQYGHVRTLGYKDTASPLEITPVSKLIEPTLEAMTFDDGDMIYYKRKLRVTGKTPVASSNDLTLYHDSNYDAWGSYGHYDVVCYAEYSGKLLGMSAVTGDVWVLDDGYNANGNPYYSEAITKSYNFGKPHQYKSLIFVRMDGFITSNCPAYIDFFFDDSSQPLSFLLSGDNTKIIGDSANVATGTVVFGAGVFGGGLPDGVLRKPFLAHLQFNTIPPFLKVAMRIRIDSQDVDFEMNNATMWAREEGSNLWLPQKVVAVT